MHKDLEDMLKWAWGERETIMSKAPVGNGDVKAHMVKSKYNGATDYIYEYYTKAENNRENPKRNNEDICEKFKRRIVEIKRGLPGCTLKIQSNPYTEASDASEGHVMIMFLSDVRSAFFHFRKRRAHASHRIYVNLTEHGRLRAFYGLAQLVWNNAGLTTCKVAGPGAPRADSAVFYFDCEAEMENAIQAITPYVRQNTAYFNVEVPKLTKRVPGLQGVSIGMEPPAKHLIKVGGTGDNEVFSERIATQSFGTYRAELIYMALENSERPSLYSWKSGRAYRKFKDRAQKYFRVAGLDPDHPWLNEYTVRANTMMLPATALKSKIRAVERGLRH